MTDSAVDHTDFSPPARRLTRLLVIAGVLVLLAAGVAAVVWLPPRLACDGPGSGVVERDGECIGVTDGSPAFLPGGGEGLRERYRAVQERIEAENDRVADEESSAVKVALLSTLSATPDGPLSPEQVLHSLHGAHVAQMRANHTRELGDPAPQIQLYLANAGSGHDRWEPVVDELVGMTDDRAPLVAVVGLGPSVEATREAAERLSAEDIPMVSSVASATSLRHAEVPGLVRVTPSNTDFVAALHAYVGGRDMLDTAMLVHDESPPDLHVKSLTDAFTRTFAEQLAGHAPQPFQGKSVSEDVAYTYFDAVVRNLCAAEADMALFSGRTVDLREFLEALHVRPCLAEPVSVLFVETGPVIPPEEVEKLRRSRITVVHASAADPAWADEERATGPVPEGHAPFEAAFRARLPEVTDVEAALQDGYAAAHHDAVMVAVRALRLTHSGEDGQEPSAARTARALFLLNEDNTVPGASGTLSYSTSRGGDPGRKPVPVLEVPARGPAPDLYVTPAL
ncbi:ABC transporter substrate-binding protein [Streptomyces sp. GSL17-111]|uniref:ABC transporter substrate-binding protein n=1 Tax=Streptomyces sp. GSL17-111 TaxID=3121596 RepID=UPI0030F3861D